MSIVTFYSYKGGVGRSMALANVAFELAKRGKKILIVDWDLEAPGLEKYFSNYSIDNIGNGLLPLLLTVDKGFTPDYNEYLWTIHINSTTTISFLHSGREKDPNNYSIKLENFNWDNFFSEKGGGAFLETLRTQWINDFDLVLIDSRTGLSDSSGICTILFPDIVIPLFTANYQSLYGVRDIMRFAQNARHKLEIERMGLTILPIPTRFGTRVEFKESQEWLDRFAEVLKEFFSDWLPKWIEPKHVLEQVKIPQVDYFSFGEKLAVAEQGTNDPESMGFIFSKIAAFLASDFEDLPSFVGKEFYDLKKEEYKKRNKNNKPLINEKFDNDEFDVFISHPNSSLTNLWISEFRPIFIEYLTEELNYTPKIFIDVQEVSVGESWSESIVHALKKSKVLLALLTPNYFNSTNNIFELEAFLEREKRTNNLAIVPISIKSFDYDVLPTVLLDRQIIDFSEFSIDDLRKRTKLRVRFAQEVEKVAMLTSAIIKENVNPEIKKAFSKPKDENSEEIHQIVKSLAKEYEELREKVPSSNNRTRLMQYVTSKMIDAAPKITPILQNLINSNSPGERLAAITALHKNPDPHYLDWLSDRIGDKEKPFISYQAAVGLYILTKSFGKTHKVEIANAIDKAMANIALSNKKDPNQMSVLNTAKTELDYY